MTGQTSVAKTLRAIERYNATCDKIDATEARLRKLYAQRDEQRTKAFKALPPNHGITMGERFSLSSWDADQGV